MTNLYNEILSISKEIRTLLRADEISYIRMGGRTRLAELENKMEVLENKYMAELKRLEIEF
jgi:hypothetical protein